MMYIVHRTISGTKQVFKNPYSEYLGPDPYLLRMVRTSALYSMKVQLHPKWLLSSFRICTRAEIINTRPALQGSHSTSPVTQIQL